MTLSVFEVGATVRLEADLTDLSGNLFDPATVTFRYRRPGDAAPTEVTASRSAAGQYYALITVDTPGEWRWEVRTTGGLAIVKSQRFRVFTSQVDQADVP
jgi:nitrogen fixation protein FixH